MEVLVLLTFSSYYENSRPAWTIVPENIYEDKNVKAERVTWIPTLDNMLEDSLLMIAIYVLKDKEIYELSQKFFKNKQPNWVELYDDIDAEDLAQLYDKCRTLETSYKLVITVMDGSTILGQLGVLENYKMDVEVCTPQYSRLFSHWSNETVIRGSLTNR